MSVKMPNKRALMLCAIVALLVIALQVQFASAAPTPTTLSEECVGIIPPPGTQSPIIVNIASFSSLIGISILIILLMTVIIAIAYSLGHAFGIDKLTTFAKTEAGEIAITIIVVGIFLGAFTATSSVANSNLFAIAGSSFNSNIFLNDCNAVMSSSAALISPELAFVLDTSFISMASGASFNLQLSSFGISFQPYAGDQFLSSIMQTLENIGGIMIGLLFGMGIFLAVIYGLFPLFLFAGIILRTLPVTRPAGGAMLGLFAAFYILLPIMLHFFLFYNSNYITDSTITAQNICPTTGTSTQTQTPSTSTSTSSTSAIPCNTAGFFSGIIPMLTSIATGTLSAALNIGGTASTSMQGLSALLNGNIVQLFVQDIIEPVFYTLIAFVLSLVMAYDFMEAVGDLLGAPSLNASTMLKNVV